MHRRRHVVLVFLLWLIPLIITISSLIHHTTQSDMKHFILVSGWTNLLSTLQNFSSPLPLPCQVRLGACHHNVVSHFAFKFSPKGGGDACLGRKKCNPTADSEIIEFKTHYLDSVFESKWGRKTQCLLSLWCVDYKLSAWRAFNVRFEERSSFNMPLSQK